MIGRLFVCIVVVLTATCVPAAAQQVPRTSLAAPDPKACAPGERIPHSDTPRQRSTTGQNLSDRLSRTDGVLCPPPNVDPNMHVPAPDTGRMPVIPPPGSPGGDPGTRPK